MLAYLAQIESLFVQWALELRLKLVLFESLDDTVDAVLVNKLQVVEGLRRNVTVADMRDFCVLQAAECGSLTSWAKAW